MSIWNRMVNHAKLEKWRIIAMLIFYFETALAVFIFRNQNFIYYMIFQCLFLVAMGGIVHISKKRLNSDFCESYRISKKYAALICSLCFFVLLIKKYMFE